jgi:peptidoglycan/LPS O-acetylase OafA/YrhL
MERSLGMKFPRILKAIGDWSYSIYLSHVIVTGAIVRLIGHFMPNLSGAFLLFYLFALPAVVGVGWLSFTYIERPLINILYGRRFIRKKQLVAI